MRLLLLTLLAVVTLSVPAHAQVPTLPTDGGSRLEGPACTTFDAEHQPATSFRAGDPLILTGSSFPAGALVLAMFQQTPHSSELGRFKTNEAGEFTSEPSLIRLPSEAAAGPAAIRVSSSGGSATCTVEVRAAAVATARRVAAEADDSASEGTNPWLIVWGTIVAVIGVFLAYVTYRRWQAERLAEAISRIKGTGGARTPTQPPVETTIARNPSPPVLPNGWDEGREPTPIRPE